MSDAIPDLNYANSVLVSSIDDKQKYDDSSETTSLLLMHNQPNQKAVNNQCASKWNFKGFFRPLNYILDIFVRAGRNGSDSLDELDGIRALAFLWVFVTHCTLLNPAYIDNSSYIEFPNSYLRSLAEVGYQGVTSFFVLSGFLIPMVLVSRFNKMDGNFSAFNIKYAELFINFMIKRLLRIAPSLWATLGIAMLYGRYSADSKAKEYMYKTCTTNFWTNFAFCSNFYGSCLGGFWSVSVEMQFYILSAIPVYFYLKKPSYGWIAVTLWTVAVVIARFIVLAYIVNQNNSDTLSGYFTMYEKYIYKNTFLRADAYAIGMGTFMFLEWLKTQNNYLITPYGQSTPLKQTMMIVIPAFLIITPFFLSSCVPLTWLELTDGGSDRSAFTPTYLYYSCTADVLVAADTAGIIIMVTTTRGGNKTQEKTSSSSSNEDCESGESSPLLKTKKHIVFNLKYFYCRFSWFMSQVLSSSYLYPIASLSYTAYLLTEPAIRMYMDMVLYKWVDGDTLGKHTLLAIFVYTLELLVLLGLAFLLSLFIERPFMRLSNRIKVRIQNFN